MPDDTSIEADLILAAIEQAAAGPRQISTDAGQVTYHSLADLIAMHKYIAAVETSKQTTAVSGLRFAQLIPGGTVQRSNRGGRPWR